MNKVVGIVIGALCALMVVGVSRVEAAPMITLSYSLRPVSADGVRWVDYAAVSTSGVSSPNFDWAVVQDCNGTLTGSRLYKNGPKSGETYLDAPAGASCTAWVVDLINGGIVGTVPISNTVAFTAP
jgi:hypothetical protein